MSGDGRKDEAASAASIASAQAASSFGLVPSPTSDRKNELHIDRFESRHRRLKKNVLTSCRLLRDSREHGSFRYFMAMLTVTYAPGNEYEPHHITDLHKRIRAWLRYRGHDYGYVWVCELQERGAPHYHVLIWVPHGERLPKADAFGWWPYGSTRIEKVERAVGYLIKYLSKGQDTIHRFKKGQRTHGSGGLSKEDKIERRWWLAPKFARARWPTFDADIRRAPGGGWVSGKTGEWMPSPWQFISWSPITGAVIRWIAGPAIGVFGFPSGNASA